jgi:hypothetical protein
MSNMDKGESTTDLVTFYALLENAFPANSIEVGFDESRESYLNEIRGLLFNGQDWRAVDFPDNENDAVAPAFDLLHDDSKLYYIASYMREAAIDIYYQASCLAQLKKFAHMPGGLLGRMDPYQRESVVWFCDLVEAQINSLPMMERLEYAVDTMTAKYLRNTIRNTLW